VLVYRRVSREPLTGGFSKYHTKLCNSLNFDPAIHDCLCYLPHAVNCGRFCFWRRQFVFCVCVCVCVWNISETAERICTKFTRKTCHLDEFKGQGQRSKVTKTAFSALFLACVRFIFGKIFSASCSKLRSIMISSCDHLTDPSSVMYEIGIFSKSEVMLTR